MPDRRMYQTLRNDERFRFYARASKDCNNEHVTAYRHMTKCRLRWRIAQTFPVSKRRTIAESNSNTCGFLCTERPRPTQNSRFILNSRPSVNIKGISWARELRK